MDRGAHQQVADKWEDARTVDEDGLGGARPARRGRARGGARGRPRPAPRADARLDVARAAACARDSRRRRGASPSRCGARTPADGAAASRRASAPSAERAADLGLRDLGLRRRHAGPDPQLRQRLRDREGARLEQPAQHAAPWRSWRSRSSASSSSRAWAAARWCTRLASSRSRIGLRSHGSRIAATASAHGAPRSHSAPKPKNAGHDDEPQVVAALGEVLDRGQDAVARAALARRRARDSPARARGRRGRPGRACRRRPGAGRPPGSARRRSSRRAARAASRRRGTSRTGARRRPSRRSAAARSRPCSSCGRRRARPPPPARRSASASRLERGGRARPRAAPPRARRARLAGRRGRRRPRARRARPPSARAPA